MERHALLLKCAMTFLIYIRHSGEVSRDIYMLSMVYIMRFLPRSTLNFHTNFHILSILVVWEIACWAERRDIHWCQNVWKPSLFSSGIGGKLQEASLCSSWFILCKFCKSSTLNFHTKLHVWGTLSAWEIAFCATRTDIHCCWSVSYHSLYAVGIVEELPIASSSSS